MIRYRDKEYKDYFINPYTGIVTDKNGQTIQAYIHRHYYVVNICGKALPVHCIQAHTYYGFRPDKVVHHIDRNRLNNTLFNIYYDWTPEQHNSYHSRNIDEIWRKKLSVSGKGRISPLKGKQGRKKPDGFSENLSKIKKGNTNVKGKKWFNNGVKNIMSFTCPDSFVPGRLKKQ